MKRKIAILAPRFDEGDAVGIDSLQMKRLFESMGHECMLFAGGWSMEAGVRLTKRLDSFLDRNSILIYQYTVAWPEGLEAYRRVRCVKIIRYHNVTPPEFFEPYHAGIANACRVGRQTLPCFLDAGFDLLLADSEYNGKDLLDAGGPRDRIKISPPFHRIDEMRGIDASFAGILDLAGQYPDAPLNWLMVGRIVPNKKYENLLLAFAHYRQAFNPNSRLVIAGRRDPQLESYTNQLDAIIRENRLENSVYFTGHVKDSYLKSCFLSASIFVMMSEHEGFCVPLLEAMSYRLPVLALAGSAVSETAGTGALLLDRPSPALFASAADQILRSEDTAFALGARGFNRYTSAFSFYSIKSALTAGLQEWLDG